jgi:hypothetical protein
MTRREKAELNVRTQNIQAAALERPSACAGSRKAGLDVE